MNLLINLKDIFENICINSTILSCLKFPKEMFQEQEILELENQKENTFFF